MLELDKIVHGFLFGVVTAVFCAEHRRWTKVSPPFFLSFAIIGFAGVGLNQFLMFLLVGQGNVNEMFAKAVAAGIVLLWNFGARKFFLFRSVKEMV
jgi:putative flippase GtrA